jgi:hypothetical protein
MVKNEILEDLEILFRYERKEFLLDVAAYCSTETRIGNTIKIDATVQLFIFWFTLFFYLYFL